MAEQQGKWVTINGAHVFIRDGEQPDFGNRRKLQKTVKPENQLHQKDEEELKYWTNEANKLQYESLSKKAENLKKVISWTKNPDSKAEKMEQLKKIEAEMNKYKPVDDDTIDDWEPWQNKDVSNEPTNKIINSIVKYYRKSNSLDLKQMIFGELRTGGNLSKKDNIKIQNWEFRKTGNGWEAYEDGKRIWTGTTMSVADGIAHLYDPKNY